MTADSDLLAAHYGRIYRFVRRRTRTAEDAEDLTQTVFLEAAARLTDLQKDDRPLVAWLYTVARRRLSDTARRRRIRGVSVALQDVMPGVDELEYGAPIAALIRGAVSSLPEQQRRAVVMRLIHGVSFGEIARATGASEAACKMRVARGVAAIRDFLEREGIEP